jgi:hypothetical protein
MGTDIGCGRHYIACAVFLYLLVSLQRAWAGILF